MTDDLRDRIERIIETHTLINGSDECTCGVLWEIQDGFHSTDGSTCYDNHLAGVIADFVTDEKRQPAVPENETLRDRIAAVLCAHPDRWDGTCCGGHDFGTQDEWAAHVADAVIRALDLDLGICATTGCRMRQIARAHAEASSALCQSQMTHRRMSTMTDNLRARVAAVIVQSCHGVFVDDAVRAADAVIREIEPLLQPPPEAT